MWSRYWRNLYSRWTRRFHCFMYCLPLITALYTELLVYYLTAHSWPQLTQRDFKNPIRILLVADPQIVGELFEPRKPIGNLFRWDADNYLRKTYFLVHEHVQPHIVVYLGDLLDEGSITTDRKVWDRYMQRFFSIFPQTSNEVSLFLPGDNDIGGESDPITREKINRFFSSFKNHSTVTYRFIQIVPHQLNIQKLREEVGFHNQTPWTNFIIYVDHFARNGYIFQKEKGTKHTEVDLLIGAHTHRSRIRTWHRGTPFSEDVVAKQDEYAFDTTEKGVEIIVPTCSYRMGVTEMGYGFLEIFEDRKMRYAVLWLPQRFSHIWGLLFMTSISFLFTLLHYVKMCMERHKSWHHCKYLMQKVHTLHNI